MNKKKVVSILILTPLFLFVLAFAIIPDFRYAVGMTLFHIFSDTNISLPAELIKVVDNYNKICGDDYQVKISDSRKSSSGNNSITIKFEFIKKTIDDDNKRFEFLNYLSEKFDFSKDTGTMNYINISLHFDNIIISPNVVPFEDAY